MTRESDDANRKRALARQRALSRLQEKYSEEFWEMYQQERVDAGLKRSTRSRPTSAR